MTINNPMKQVKIGLVLKLLAVVTILFTLFKSDLTLASDQETEQSLVTKLEIIPSGDSPIQKITLNDVVYQASNGLSLGHMNIIDSQGNSLPYKLQERQKASVTQTKSLKLYPLFEESALAQTTNLVTFEYDQSNRLSRIEENVESTMLRKVIGYLIDFENDKASGSPSYGELVFQLTKVSDTRFLRFDIDQSNDLKTWRRLSSSEVLAQLVDGKNYSQQNKVSISNLNTRFLRLTFSDRRTPFPIDSVDFNYLNRPSTNFLWGDFISAEYDKNEQAFIANISSAATYSRIQFDLPKLPSIYKGELYTRMGPQSPWRKKSSINLYRFKNGNRLITNDQLALNNLRGTQLKIKLDYLSEQDKNKPVSLKMAWMPQELIFFANGNAPYSLVIGDSNHPFNKDDAMLLENMKDQLTQKIKPASFGEITETLVDRTDKSPVDWKIIILWAVLIIGVLVMAWMAKGLLKQL